ncbi:MAG: aldolase/citrate lyase family protein [Gammaproteobacteria bacterium]|nr:aldolase/citrate lyase family protein [Gammaproteobacteria bacterium]
MYQPLSLKQRLKAGERLHGCWIEAFSPIMTEIVAQSGYDVAMIDLEHGPGSTMDAVRQLQVLAAYDCAPLIRVPSADSNVIKKAMDIGPGGLMIPDIRTVRQARDVVSACRYGPRGSRGAAPALVRASGYGRNLERYLAGVDDGFLVIGQIESREGAGNIDGISGVDGLDMLFVGPSDLSASLGALGDFASEEFGETFSNLERAILDAGKWLGCIPFHDRDAARLYENGHHLVISGVDTLLLREAAETDVMNLNRSKVGDPA